jgi:hypothetical protein
MSEKTFRSTTFIQMKYNGFEKMCQLEDEVEVGGIKRGKYYSMGPL